MKKILFQDLKALIEVFADAESQRIILSQSNVDMFFWRGGNGFYTKIQQLYSFYHKYLSKNESVGKILYVISESVKKISVAEFEKQVINLHDNKIIIYEILNYIELLEQELNNYYSINTLFQFSNISFNSDILFSKIEAVFEDITWQYIPESAKGDIVEGGKALLFGLPTCASFMFLRALEDCIRKLCQQLNHDIKNLTFGNAINIIEKDADKFKIEKKDFERQISYLKYIKDEFRNPSAHPEKTFTQKESEQLFQAINIAIDKIRYLKEKI
ncbi:MAG: hypothetical protein V2B20_01255 [Pseudomonadota bacterium]